MTSYLGSAHTYQPPDGMPGDYAGPCIDCSHGRWAPQHRNPFERSADTLAALLGRIERARDLAASYQSAVMDPAARVGFAAIIGALAEPAATGRAA